MVAILEKEDLKRIILRRLVYSVGKDTDFAVPHDWLVALTLAASQLGPRLLRSFMRDSATQVVLGTFIATYLYCLLVLRTIRHAEEVVFGRVV